MAGRFVKLRPMPTGVMAIVITAVLACTSRYAGAVETQMVISTTAIDFGLVNVGSSASASVTLTNAGGDSFGPINIFGGAPPTAEFNASQNCQANTLPAGGSCMVTYSFSPGAAGTFNDTSSFTFSETASQADGEDFSVSLAGVGFDPNATTTLTPSTTTTSSTSSTTSTTRPASGWTPSMHIRSVNGATTALDPPEIAMNARGDAVVVWEEEESERVIKAAVRAPGGSFAVVSPALSQAGATDPKAGIDAAGNATVAWTQGQVVQTAVRPAGGSFAGAQDILGSGPLPTDVELAVDASGRAVAVWRTSSGVKASVRPANGSFAAPTTLSPAVSISSYESAIAGNARGDAVAVILYQAVTPVREFAAFAWADGGATYLGPSGLSSFLCTHPRVAVGAQGDAVAVWKQTFNDPPSNPSSLRAAIRPAGGTFTGQPGLVIPGTGTGSEYPTVAVDAAGNVILVWSEGIGVMQSTFRPAGGEFGPPQDVPGTSGVTESRVLFAPDGTAVTAFFQNDQIAASVRPPGGTFALATTLSPIDAFAFDVRLAVDDEGNVLAAWYESTTDGESIGAAFYDPVPPRLEGLVVPATGRVAQAVDVAVAPVDRVGPVVSIAWSFGDGGTADTTSASHVYATPGSYNVIVTATDAVGNQSTQTTTISIALCTSVADCRAVLAAALPDPGAATGKARRVARRLAALARKVGVLLDKASRTTGLKQARQQRRAAAALDRLVTIARKAQSRDRLGVPLAPLEAAVDAFEALLPVAAVTR